MRRELESELLAWKNRRGRMPLLLRGARQVGKTHLLERFGQNHFKHTALVNFEFQHSAVRVFETLDPHKIVSELELLLKVPIVPGETLLIFDEIQECPRAIMSLRYFKERMPELHVIGAGSLLEFAIEDERFSFPVGRIEYLHLGPLSFREFLQATGEISLLDQTSPAIHERLMELLRHYFLLGGMPMVVAEYLESGSFQRARQLQGFILETYQQDFGKYARKTEHRYLQKLFEQAPLLACHPFKYSKVDPGMRSRELSVALDHLCHAGLVRRIHATHANGLPLRAEADPKKFKLLFLDLGLLQAANQVDPSSVLSGDLVAINAGQLAEQFVGQELLAYSEPHEERHLFFWERNKTGSAAEIDYVVRIDSQIVPIEVKAGATGRLRSLHQFLSEKKRHLGVRISERPLHRENDILSIPFYAIAALPSLLTG